MISSALLMKIIYRGINVYTEKEVNLIAKDCCEKGARAIIEYIKEALDLAMEAIEIKIKFHLEKK